MDTTSLTEAITHATDLKECGKNIMKFSDACSKEINSVKLINILYSQILTMDENINKPNLPVSESTESYSICEGNAALIRQLRLTLPSDFTLPAAKRLKDLRLYGKTMSETYTSKKGRRLTKVELENILDYMETEFSFVSKVLCKDSVPLFLLFDSSMPDAVAEVTIRNYVPNVDASYIFRLFSMNIREHQLFEYPNSPVFHEFGHALHFRRYGNLDILPDHIINYIKSIHPSVLNNLPNSIKKELLADFLGAGMMYGSPFDNDKKVNQMFSPSQKAAMKEMVRTMLSEI